ncbi:MAG: hypothetical protein ACJA2X_000225 [Halocynthiibacter sp.]|jgi:hypothetical protein
MRGAFETSKQKSRARKDPRPGFFYGWIRALWARAAQSHIARIPDFKSVCLRGDEQVFYGLKTFLGAIQHQTNSSFYKKAFLLGADF